MKKTISRKSSLTRHMMRSPRILMLTTRKISSRERLRLEVSSLTNISAYGASNISQAHAASAAEPKNRAKIGYGQMVVRS